MGIDRRSFLTASASVILTVTTALHWIAMLLLAGMISDGAMAQTPPAREPVGKLELVAAIMGGQPAGIAVSGQGRIFVAFPRHDGDVAYAVGEIKDGQIRPFPNLQVNRAGSRALDALFSVQGLLVDTSIGSGCWTLASPRSGKRRYPADRNWSSSICVRIMSSARCRFRGMA
jgi:hypothetical protein